MFRERPQFNPTESVPESGPKAERLLLKRYTTEAGTAIDISWKEFQPPQEEEGQRDRAVIFLPGWAMGADASSTRRLVEALSEKSKSISFSVTSRSEKETPDSLYEQADAISKFIKEQGLREITLVGHSQGGDKAIDITAILQEDPEMKINGLVLLDSVGLYEQKPVEFTGQFIKNYAIDTPLMLARDFPKKPLIMAQTALTSMRGGTDILLGLARDIWKSKLSYFTDNRLPAQIRQMVKVNPYLQEIRVPVILISGSEDPVSDPEKIVPSQEEEKEALRIWEKRQASSDIPYADPREEYLKRELLPNSPYVRMVIPDKLGQHGLPLFRSESIARASLYLLDRFNRRQISTQEDIESTTS